MSKIVESVPNFSEGRDEAAIQKILEPFQKAEGVKLLDSSADRDHNRLVVTLIGEPEAVKNSVLEASFIAIDNIDMNSHQGEHPRMGAVDVVPFTPVRNVKMEEAVEMSEYFAEKLAESRDVPVFLYEESARSPERKNLAEIRKGDYEGLEEKLQQPEWKPDYGPAKPHKTAGGCVTGARMPLVAFNINLDTSDKSIADRIARNIRHSGGGLRYCKAIGIDLAERGIAQVSMNMTNYKETSLYQVMEMVKFEAERYGVKITGSELIGLLPAQALIESAEYYLKLEDFKPEQIIENRLLEDL